MSKLKAIIFDIDGVLVDSQEANIALFQILLKHGGYPKPRREDIVACFHKPLWQTLEYLTKSDDQNEIKRLCDMAQLPEICRLRPPDLFKYPEELHETLQSLSRSYTLAVVTSRIRAGMEEVFEMSNIGHYFSVVVTFEDYENPKPHPEPLLIAAKKLRIKPSEAVYIGDGPTDIEAAREAGMKSIHLSDETHPDATSGVRHFDELLKAIEGLSSK